MRRIPESNIAVAVVVEVDMIFRVILVDGGRSVLCCCQSKRRRDGEWCISAFVSFQTSGSSMQ